MGAFSIARFNFHLSFRVSNSEPVLSLSMYLLNFNLMSFILRVGGTNLFYKID